MKIDSHQHFWSLSRGDYGWMSPELGPIYRDFGLDDLAPLLRDAGIGKTIVVQAADTVAETEFLLQIAGRSETVAGVVGWIDMEAPEAIAELERLARDRHFRGIRPMIQEIADDDWILKPELDPVFAALVEMELTFDALVLPRHLPRLLQRLDRHPDLKCVIDHCAKPDLRTGEIADWARDMTQLARSTDCLCKVSGLATEANAGWTLDDLRPATDLVLAEFGPGRLMFGSDWPVLNLAGDYAAWTKAAAKLTEGLGSSDAAAFWGGTAARFYSIEP